MSLALKIILGIAAVALGIWLGLPGRYTQTPEDIEEDMKWRRNTGTYKVKRVFTPMAWLSRSPNVGGGRGRERKRFHMEPPGDVDTEDGEKDE